MNPREEFEDRLAATLTELRGAGLLRQMRLPIGIDLVSNDYLGLAEHPHLTETMRAAVADLPAGSGGSRLLRGHHEIFEIIEAQLAAFSGSDSALLFGSGRSEEHTSELQSRLHLVCRLLLEKEKQNELRRH